ncbi:rCG48689, isoform CRA_a [Rattus norvegicus]|uniref:RCG48689, isoform CRA_a n=1 Tax=Rattus norvegicus TaxID=10116 RepID=A6IG95_RAT|nr:rCG48689, isoform CRA_a [Rattus norvegicus]EDM16804.1 rCG48689, isoform CRA_a [Rattus norvegicus]
MITETLGLVRVEYLVKESDVSGVYTNSGEQPGLTSSHCVSGVLRGRTEMI